MSQITLGKRTFTILFPDLLRPLSAQERGDLKADIEARGRVEVPVVVDERDGVIDGGHRLTIAAEVGLKRVPTIVRPGLNLEQKRSLAERLNMCRRHLSREEVQERIAQRLQQSPERSNRAVAAEVGVSDHTVARVRENLESTAHIAQLDARQGADGKLRPARTPARAEPPRSEPPRSEPPRIALPPQSDAEDEDESDDGAGAPCPRPPCPDRGPASAAAAAPVPAEPVDAEATGPAGAPAAGTAPPPSQRVIACDPHGRPWPERALVALGLVPEFDALAREFGALALKVNRLKNTPIGHHFDAGSIENHLTRCAQAFKSGRPYAVCPYCGGAGHDAEQHRCKPCRGDGWVNRQHYESSPLAQGVA